MTHELAVKNHTAARYLLEELPPEERDAFEEHYFSCLECADEVRAGAALRANTRAVFAERAFQAAQPSAEEKPGWLARVLGWRGPLLVPYAAAASLAGITLWLGLVTVPSLREGAMEPQLIASAALRPTIRGAEQTVRIAPGDRFFELVLDINSETPYARYECDLVRQNGDPMFTVGAPVQGARPSSLNLLLPAARFEAGQYTVILLGRDSATGGRTEIDRFKFTIERR